jgi:hypothetical protein
LGEAKQHLRDRRKKNCERVRRQLERKRLARFQKKFQPRFRFDGAGEIWTELECEHVASVTGEGEVIVARPGVSRDEIISDLRRQIELFPEKRLPATYYALLGETRVGE